MIQMYNEYKKEIKNKNSIMILVTVIFIIGLVFGSLYITIISNESKEKILKVLFNYFNSMKTLSFENKIDIFKNSLY